MNISIVGVGLLGGSFALGIQAEEEGHHFIGVDTNPVHTDKALEMGIIHEVAYFNKAIASADLVVLATPVNVILRQLPETLDLLPDRATLIDLGSTKASFCQAVAGHPKRHHYVACHPIAGTENSGPEAAFPGLLRHKQLIICDKDKSDSYALGTVERFFKLLDMRISSFALGLTVLEKEKDERSIFEMAGSGFSSTVRLAKSSPDMWAPIFTQNATNISKALDAYIKLLQDFKEIIDQQSEDRSYALMEKANGIRRVLMGLEK